MRIPFPFFLRSTALPAIVALTTVLCMHRAGASPERTGRVTEVIVFFLDRPGNADDQNLVIRAARSLRRAKGVENLHVGRSMPGTRAGGEQPFDVAIVITFKNRGAWQKFERNEQLQRLMKLGLRPLVRRSIVYSFTSE